MLTLGCVIEVSLDETLDYIEDYAVPVKSQEISIIEWGLGSRRQTFYYGRLDWIRILKLVAFLLS
jgi:hypothetical protein